MLMDLDIDIPTGLGLIIVLIINLRPFDFIRRRLFAFRCIHLDPYLLKERAEYLRLMTRYIDTVPVLHPDSVTKLSHLHLVLVDYKLRDPKRFRHNLRVSPTTFDALLRRISGHPVFHNSSNMSQMDPCYQLAVALYRFGHFGNSASVEQIAQWAGISSGSAIKFTRRIMKAFMSLADEAIRWPSVEDKEDAKTWVEEVS
ncbi:hypothetical protein FRC02_006861 [Tulasnella sp. 418]|nr:hypothetical protein FRC02_006861 [Tulasnella sp. 418]